MDKEEITKYLFNTATNVLKVQDFLQENPDLDPRQYINEQKSNVLHHLSFYDHRELIKLYVSHTSRLIKRQFQNSKALYKKDVQQQISAWVNEKNIQGFTPILYAAFNGHIDLIKDLQSYGANPTITNQTNLNALHLAAQNNKVATFIYFGDKLDINSKDQKGNTPLHWAAYSCSQDTSAYILSLPNISINQRDNQGQTPLILATKYGNTKIVRRLLIKGAKRSIKQQNGKTALMIAEQQQFTNISRMLNNKYSVMDMFKFYYNVKLEYRPKNRKMTIPIVFIISSLCSLLILNGLLQFKNNSLLFIELAVMIPMHLLYFSLLLPPKKLQKQNINNYINEPRKLCFECIRKKPKRSYHCDICKICISQYDHHCTWINNCVGKQNIARFILFIFFLILCLAFIGFISLWMQMHIFIEKNVLWEWMSFRPSTLDANITKIARFVLLGINIIISIFFFPVLLLFVVQLKNICINKTTYERIRGENTSVKDQLKSKNQGGIIKNCKAMCGRTRQSFASSDQSFQKQLLED